MNFTFNNSIEKMSYNDEYEYETCVRCQRVFEISEMTKKCNHFQENICHICMYDCKYEYGFVQGTVYIVDLMALMI